MKPRIDGTDAADDAPSNQRVAPITKMSIEAQVTTTAAAPKMGPTCMIRWWPNRSDSRPNGVDRMSSAAKNVAVRRASVSSLVLRTRSA